MQLLPEQFFSLTWGQYNCRVRGWLRLEDEKWEHTRMVYGLLYNTNAKKKDQKPFTELIPLRKDRKNMLLKAQKSATVLLSREELVARLKQGFKLT